VSFKIADQSVREGPRGGLDCGLLSFRSAVLTGSRLQFGNPPQIECRCRERE